MEPTGKQRICEKARLAIVDTPILDNDRVLQIETRCGGQRNAMFFLINQVFCWINSISTT